MLWAEHRDFLAAITAVEVWSQLAEVAEDIVAGIASRAETLDPSARIWDLTVLVLVESGLSSHERQTAVPWASETRYARRLLAVSVSESTVKRALAPILPLVITPAPEILIDPTEALLAHLSRSVGADVAEAALRAFRSDGSIEI
jgi:hypothetical protein